MKPPRCTSVIRKMPLLPVRRARDVALRVRFVPPDVQRITVGRWQWCSWDKPVSVTSARN